MYYVKRVIQITKEQNMPRGGRGRRGGRPGNEPPIVSQDELVAWFTGSIPDTWFEGNITIAFDRDEIVVSGALPQPNVEKAEQQTIAEEARIESFREETRSTRMSIAGRAQEKFERHVSWVATCGDVVSDYTRANVPAMTRLDFDQRATLDTLIEAGVARSRADALQWCVTMVGRNEAAWIDELREALAGVGEVRDQGPHSTR